MIMPKPVKMNINTEILRDIRSLRERENKFWFIFKKNIISTKKFSKNILFKEKLNTGHRTALLQALKQIIRFKAITNFKGLTLMFYLRRKL